MTVRLQASLQSLVFVVLLAATLFGAAGGVNFIEFWLCVAVVAAVSGLAHADSGKAGFQPALRPVSPAHILPLGIGQHVFAAIELRAQLGQGAGPFCNLPRQAVF